MNARLASRSPPHALVGATLSFSCLWFLVLVILIGPTTLPVMAAEILALVVGIGVTGWVFRGQGGVPGPGSLLCGFLISLSFPVALTQVLYLVMIGGVPSATPRPDRPWLHRGQGPEEHLESMGGASRGVAVGPVSLDLDPTTVALAFPLGLLPMYEIHLVDGTRIVISMRPGPLSDLVDPWPPRRVLLPSAWTASESAYLDEATRITPADHSWVAGPRELFAWCMAARMRDLDRPGAGGYRPVSRGSTRLFRHHRDGDHPADVIQLPGDGLVYHVAVLLGSGLTQSAEELLRGIAASLRSRDRGDPTGPQAARILDEARGIAARGDRPRAMLHLLAASGHQVETPGPTFMASMEILVDELQARPRNLGNRPKLLVRALRMQPTSPERDRLIQRLGN